MRLQNNSVQPAACCICGFRLVNRSHGSKHSHRHLIKVRCDGSDRQSESAPQSKSSDQAPSRPDPLPNVISQPAQTVAWGGRLPSQRRAVLGGLAGLGIVLASNLGGITSGLLGIDGGQTAATLRADTLYPVRGLKRCLDLQNGYEFQYPGNWLADRTLYYRQAQRAEQINRLDPPSIGRPRQRRSVAEPTAAFGPAGSTGEENISVIVAPIREGFRLESLGSAEEAAKRFLSTTVAPEGSGLEATFLAASSRRDDSGELYYTQEFRVKGPKWTRHNVSVYAARNGLLYTLNAQCQEANWPQLAPGFEAAAASFRVLSTGRATAGFPQRL
ncbi:hypothetical protein WJX72_000166 [[Myrmecia] bisecta]|uniref:PsbP C-terminal domain-containing protein n=1 Tax=[Myrmecia] bisecta TaxID=41462 RepID=A0AAW1PWA2_9CHLO